jgi:hypothetical protein
MSYHGHAPSRSGTLPFAAGSPGRWNILRLYVTEVREQKWEAAVFD